MKLFSLYYIDSILSQIENIIHILLFKTRVSPTDNLNKYKSLYKTRIMYDQTLSGYVGYIEFNFYSLTRRKISYD